MPRILLKLLNARKTTRRKISYKILVCKDGKEYIGKMLTVKFFSYTKDGVPRFPKGKDIRDIY